MDSVIIGRTVTVVTGKFANRRNRSYRTFIIQIGEPSVKESARSRIFEG